MICRPGVVDVIEYRRIFSETPAILLACPA